MVIWEETLDSNVVGSNPTTVGRYTGRTFFHIINVVKIVLMFVSKDENKRKRCRDGPFKKIYITGGPQFLLQKRFTVFLPRSRSYSDISIVKSRSFLSFLIG